MVSSSVGVFSSGTPQTSSIEPSDSLLVFVITVGALATSLVIHEDLPTESEIADVKVCMVVNSSASPQIVSLMIFEASLELMVVILIGEGLVSWLKPRNTRLGLVLVL